MRSKWLECITTVKFDLQDGQKIDKMIPEGVLSEKEAKMVAFNSFPDSVRFKNEGKLQYTFHVRRLKPEFADKILSTTDLVNQPISSYDILQCFTFFLQRKDSKLERGYYQKSLVFVTKIKTCYSFFKELAYDISIAYFKNPEDLFLEQMYSWIDTQWASPSSKPVHELRLFNKSYVASCQIVEDFRKFEKKCFKVIEAEEEDNWADIRKRRGRKGRIVSAQTRGQSLDVSKRGIKKDLKLKEVLSLAPRVQGEFQDINIFRLLKGKRVLLWYKLWEVMILNQSLLIVADTPDICRYPFSNIEIFTQLLQSFPKIII